MMKRIALLLLLLSVVSVSHADDYDEDEYGEFYEGWYKDEIEDEGGTFIEGFETAGESIPIAFESVFSAFDPGYCGQDWVFENPGQIVSTWLAPAAIVAMILLFGVAILYMGGQLLQSPKLIATAKDELWQSIVTIIRVVFIIGTVMSGTLFYGLAKDRIPDDDVYKNSEDMPDAAMTFARKLVVEMIDTYSLLVIYNMAIHTIYSSTMWVGVSFRAMYNFNLGPVLKPLIDIIGTSLQYLSLAISEWMIHIITLCFIKRWTFSLFVPLGMLLRAIPYTRNAGEGLLMLIFALAIIYPFMFIFDYEAHKLMSLNLVEGKDAVSSFLAKSGLFAVGGSLLVIALLMGGMIFPFFFGGAVSIALELVRTSVYYIIMMGMFLPFLNIFVTLTLAREWAKIFNVNVNYLSFLKII